jgi:hypothetical protein
MLESLCRLFSKGLKVKGFKTWYNLFKKYEDIMGMINCYEEILGDFKEYPNIPIEIMTLWENLRDEKIAILERQFKKDDFLAKRLLNFSEMIEKSKIKFDKKTILQIGKAIQKEIKKISKELTATAYKFTDIESQVHELRRKVRWVGIYSQSLNGLIVLKENKAKFNWEDKYLTESVINSPYHKLVKNKSFEKHILLNKEQFMAFTWLIAQLGELKELGLQVEMLAQGFVKTENITNEQAMIKANHILESKISIDDLLQKASEIAKDFFEVDKIPKSLFVDKV